MAPIAIGPAVVVGLGPSGLLVKVAQAFGDTACPAILPVPDGPQGLEQALILEAVLAPEGLVKVFGPVSRPGDDRASSGGRAGGSSRQRRAAS